MDINVHVDIALAESTKEFLKALFSLKAQAVAEPKKAEPKKAEPVKAEPKKVEPVKTAKEVEADHEEAVKETIAEEVIAGEDPKYTQAEVRARFADAKRRGKLKEAKAVMQEIAGVDVTANLDPKYYNAVVAAVEAL